MNHLVVRPIVILGLLVSIMGVLAMPASARPRLKTLDLAQSSQALTAYRKIQCSTVDSQPVVYHWSGKAYARIEGEPDRILFAVEGMNVRQCVTINDPVKGPGFRMVSRELMLYLNPKTGEVLKTWTNPWTNKTVDVLHVANDPVNQRPMFAKDDAGKPFVFPGRIDGGRVFLPIEVPLFYRNPLAGDYQDQVGGHYHAMEIFDFVMDQADLINAEKPTTNVSVAWVRIAQWLPWMEMGSRPGLMVVNATGQTVAGIEALPPVLKDQIKNNFPIYAAPPPVDDARPNETSWTYYKKMRDSKQAARPEAK
jgi:hypothetical protein